MGAAQAEVAGLGAEVRKTQATMTGMNAKMATMGEVASTVAKVGLIGIGVAATYAIRNSIHFQKQMTLVQTQAGATGAQVKVLHDQVLELARIRPQGPEELAKGLYHFQSVFQNSQAAFAALKIASEGAAVGNANLEETSTALGSALRSQFRDTIPTIKQMKDTMGTLNAIVGAGNMRMDDLTLALGTAVVPAGINAGLTLKDVGGALAVLTDEGQRADNAATHLRMAFTLMSATSKKAEDQLGTIGIKANELGAAMHGPGGLVAALKIVRTQLEKKFPTFGPQLSNVHDPQEALQLAKRFSIISKAFGGARSSATIMLLLNNLDLLDQKTKQVAGRTGVLDHAFKVWGRTADAKVKLSLSKLQSALTDFGDHIRDKAVKWLTKFVDILTLLVDHMDTLLPIFASYIAAWAGLKLAILAVNGAEKSWLALKITKEVVGYIGAVEGFGDALALLSLEIEALPAGWIITAIALVIIAIALLITHWKKVVGVMKDVWEWAKRHWGFAALVIGVLFGPFIAVVFIIASHWKTFKGVFISVWNAIKGVVGGSAGFISKIVDSMINRVIAQMNRAIDLINLAIKVYNAIPDFLRPTGKLHTIGPIGKVGVHHTDKVIPGSKPMVLGGVGPVTTGFGPANSLGRMPGGGITTAHSLRRPRSHTPDPEPVFGDPLDGLENHVHVHLDGKEIFKSVSKHAADKKARK